MLADNAEKVADGDKASLEEVLKGAREDLESDDKARIDAAHQRVEQAVHKLAETLYKADAAAGGEAGGPGQPGPDAGASGGGDDDVIDAEFTEERKD